MSVKLRIVTVLVESRHVAYKFHETRRDVLQQFDEERQEWVDVPRVRQYHKMDGRVEEVDED